MSELNYNKFKIIKNLNNTINSKTIYKYSKIWSENRNNQNTTTSNKTQYVNNVKLKNNSIKLKGITCSIKTNKNNIGGGLKNLTAQTIQKKLETIITYTNNGNVETME